MAQSGGGFRGSLIVAEEAPVAQYNLNNFVPRSYLDGLKVMSACEQKRGYKGVFDYVKYYGIKETGTTF